LKPPQPTAELENIVTMDKAEPEYVLAPEKTGAPVVQGVELGGVPTKRGHSCMYRLCLIDLLFFEKAT
jgi:hypothetical protein